MQIIRALKPSRVSNPPPTIIPIQFILHSACDNYGVQGHLDWQYNNDQNLESTVYFSKGGPIYQIMEEWWRAQANYAANRRSDGTGAISGESGSDIPAEDPWSPQQVVAIIEYGRDVLDRYPTIARRVCRNPNDPGIGYHTMWGAPSPWTPVAKTCPGPARIIQFHTVIAPGILANERNQDMAALYNVLRTPDGADWLIGDKSIVFIESRAAYDYYKDYLRVIDVPHGQAPIVPRDVLDWYAAKVRAWGGVCDVPKA